MRIADIASIRLDPERILKSRWAHDTAHAFVAALRNALRKPKAAPESARD